MLSNTYNMTNPRIVEAVLAKGLYNSLMRRSAAARRPMACWSSALDQDPVVGVAKKVVLLQKIAVLGRVVGGHNYWHTPQPLGESVLATRRRNELRLGVNFALQLLLVTHAETEVPHVIEHDAVVALATAVSHPIKEVL